MGNRVVIWVGGVIAALLVVLVIVGVVIVNTINAQAEEQAVKDCMARAGYAMDQPDSRLGTDGYLEGVNAALESCTD